jgi:hypothetical protein
LKDSETLTKLIERDSGYFDRLSTKIGAGELLKKFEEVSKSVDIDTKFGRDVIQATDEMLTRFIYHNRTIEE